MNNSQIPPRFVPTLTDVIHPAEASVVQQKTFAHDATHRLPEQFEDQIVHRVMQRVDMVLERQLREAVGRVILAHTQALGPRLREEIELVVRESVSQAVAQELAAPQGR